MPEKEFLELKTTLGIPEEFDRAIAEPSMQSSRFSKEPPLAEQSHEESSDRDNGTEQEDSRATLVTCMWSHTSPSSHLTALKASYSNSASMLPDFTVWPYPIIILRISPTEYS